MLSDLIAGDLADLDETGRRVLGVIAAVAPGTGHDLLLRVAEVDDDRLEAALRAAIDAELIVVDRDTDRYRFRHVLIGEIVYAELLPPERRRLHRHIAEVLREQPAYVLTRADRASELAFHLDRAGSRRRRSPRCSPPQTRPSWWRQGWPCATSSAPSSCGMPRVTRPQGPDWVIGCGRRPSWPAGQPATSEPPLWPARPATDPRRGARRGGTSGSVATCGRPGTWSRARSSSRPPPPSYPARRVRSRRRCPPGWARPSSCSAVTTPPKPGRGVCSSCCRPRPLTRWRGPWLDAAGIVTDYRGDPAGGVELCREAVETAPSALTRALAVLYLGVSLLDAGRYQDAVNEMLDAAADVT